MPLLLFLLFLSSGNSFGQADVKNEDTEFYEARSKWFSAWKLVCKDIYKIDRLKKVDFVFYDDKYVYTTSALTGKDGQKLEKNKLMNLSLKWKKKEHNHTIILPDSTLLPVQLQSFAAENKREKGKAFFVMPLPSFWKKSGVDSKELGIGNLVCGVFVHEFSHSQQMQNFGKRMGSFEKDYHFDTDFNDDIIQNLFSKNADYTALYNKEVKLFYNSVLNENLDKSLLKEGLQTMYKRQGDYFKDKNSFLKEIDNFFLTMEGLGQYSMYLWLINPKGGNIEKSIALEGVRRNKKWWSQDEGLVLFLILEKMTEPHTWVKIMFGDQTVSAINLIENRL